MPKLPRISGAAAVRALARLGFEKVRQSGSHIVMRRGSIALYLVLRACHAN
jgi:predicted RNA binding protein YcfA (HicA-like mRNA interferase family)